MKLLTIPRVYFNRVAYAGDRALVSVDYSRRELTVRFWQLADDAEPLVIPYPQNSMLWALFFPGGERFLRVQGLWPEGAELPAALTDDLASQHPALEPASGWNLAGFSDDGLAVLYCETVVTGGRYSARFHLRDPAGGLHPLYHTRGIFSSTASFTPDGKLVAMSGGSRLVAVWDVAERREVCQLEQSDGVREVLFVDEHRLAVAAGRTVRVWDVKEQRELFKVAAFRKYVDALAVSPDRRLLAAGCRDSTVRIWQLGADTAPEVASYDWKVDEIKDLAFAPDGATAVAAGYKGLVVWDIEC
jgi:WD40 repeat protein